MPSRRERALQGQLDQSQKSSKGKDALIRGMAFEQKMAERFARQGWVITPRKQMLGYEYDLYGEMSKAFSVDILLVECKDTERVTAKDVARFIHKVGLYEQRMESGKLLACLCFTGDVDPDARYTAKANNIELKPVKRS